MRACLYGYRIRALRDGRPKPKCPQLITRVARLNSLHQKGEKSFGIGGLFVPDMCSLSSTLIITFIIVIGCLVVSLYVFNPSWEDINKIGTYFTRLYNGIIVKYTSQEGGKS